MTVDSFNAWIDKWIRPTTLVTVIGAIIWGVQLNFAILQQTEINAQQASLIVTLDEAHRELQLQEARTSLLLDQVSVRLADVTKRVLEHDKEAEQWKRKILLMEQQINNHSK